MSLPRFLESGEGGIRTHGDLRHNGLANRPVQPLLHLSNFRIFNDPAFAGSGGSRIRTHGSLRYNGFQDRRFRPLSHPTFFLYSSAINYTLYKWICQEKIAIFFLGFQKRCKFPKKMKHFRIAYYIVYH